MAQSGQFDSWIQWGQEEEEELYSVQKNLSCIHFPCSLHIYIAMGAISTKRKHICFMICQIQIDTTTIATL